MAAQGEREQDAWQPIAKRLQLGIKRRDVVLGGHRLVKLAKRKDVAMVWATEDLSRRSLGKLKLNCRAHGIPLMQVGTSDAVGAATGETSVKVYIIKRSLSGVDHIIHLCRPYFSDQ